MIFWHLGATVAIARYVFKDPAMDLRWLMFGAILPDLIDTPIGSIFFHDTFGTHRLFAHALVFPVALLTLTMIITRRGTTLRKGAMAVVIGVFIHLVLDGVWMSPDAFLWPFLGTEFPPLVGSDFPTLVKARLTNPIYLAGEALGIAYLAFLWMRHLREPGGVRRFVRTGRIPLGH